MSQIEHFDVPPDFDLDGTFLLPLAEDDPQCYRPAMPENPEEARAVEELISTGAKECAAYSRFYSNVTWRKLLIEQGTVEVQWDPETAA